MNAQLLYPVVVANTTLAIILAHSVLTTVLPALISQGHALSATTHSCSMLVLAVATLISTFQSKTIARNALTTVRDALMTQATALSATLQQTPSSEIMFANAPQILISGHLITVSL